MTVLSKQLLPRLVPHVHGDDSRYDFPIIRNTTADIQHKEQGVTASKGILLHCIDRRAGRTARQIVSEAGAMPPV